MKTIISIFTSVLLAYGIPITRAAGMPPPAGIPDATIAGYLNTRCISPDGGTVYLHMIIEARGYPVRQSRPMNIAIVLDRSGSMEDEGKMEYAKEAVLSLVDRLSTEDYLSIVIYDDKIETLLPSRRVTDRRQIRRLVREVHPRGSTNLGGGMSEGFHQIEENFRDNYINRVILLSDGLANQGITDPHKLNRIAQKFRQRSISLTTMGVGLDYNENLMLGLAESGGGNYYFIESPGQLASIFERETAGIAAITIRNARIELSLGSGIEMADVIGCEWRRDVRGRVIPVGDMAAGERRELTVELSLPPGKGRNHVADAILRYDTEDMRPAAKRRFSIDILYTTDVAELERGKDFDTQARVDIALSTRAVERALHSLDAGERGQAAVQIEEAKAALATSPAMTNSTAGAPLLQERIRELDAYRNRITDDSSDGREAKKTIQYDNYRKQKQK